MSSYGIVGNPELMSAFHLSLSALGLFCYAWALYSQRHRLSDFGEFFILSLKFSESQARGAQNTYGCLYSILLLDVLSLSSAASLSALLLTHRCDGRSSWCFLASSVWIVTRALSLALHLISALISVLFLTLGPEWGHCLRWIGKFLHAVPCVLAFLHVKLDIEARDVFILVLGSFNLAIIVAVVVTCFFPGSSKRKIFVFCAVFTYLSICLPNFVLECLLFTSPYYLIVSVNLLYVTGFHVFMNGLLFKLMLSLSGEEVRRCRDAVPNT